MLPLLGNWKIYIGIGFIAGCIVSYGINGVWDIFEEAWHKNDMTKLSNNLNEQCAKDQALAQGVSNEYQIKLTNTTNKLNAALRKLREPRPTTEDSSTSGHDATSGSGRLYYTDPEHAVPILELAGIATKQAEQLIACQSFIKKERELNN